MRIEEAKTLSETLTAQAQKANLLGNDGNPLKFKVTHTKGVNGYSVKPVIWREVRNIMSGLMVWEDVDTPYYMSVGSESYWSA